MVLKSFRGVLLILGFLCLVFVFPGCKQPERAEPADLKPDYDRPLPPGQLGLRKITNPEEIPDFTMACAYWLNLGRAIDNSLSYMSKPSSEGFYPYGDISHDRVVASLEAFREMLDSRMSPSQMNAAIRERFDVYTSVGWNGYGTVLFTGYYTPIFDASMKRTIYYKYPLYSKPDDLIKTETGEILGRRLASGKIVPYPPRSVLKETDMLEGNELVYLTDPFEVYIAHVQGSAVLRFPDGSERTVGYAANNGHEYVSVGRELINDGRITAGGLSLQGMIDFFNRNPGLVDEYVNRNPRFVFFRFEKGMPRGSLNEPVIDMRTIATDKDVYPRAALAFISARLPRQYGGSVQNIAYSGFVLDQDTGGAIRAPGRCDVYMGVGEQAGNLAGRTYTEGRLYYLFIKEDNQLPGIGGYTPGVDMNRYGNEYERER